MVSARPRNGTPPHQLCRERQRAVAGPGNRSLTLAAQLRRHFHGFRVAAAAAVRDCSEEGPRLLNHHHFLENPRRDLDAGQPQPFQADGGRTVRPLAAAGSIRTSIGYGAGETVDVMAATMPPAIPDRFEYSIANCAQGSTGKPADTLRKTDPFLVF
jgi:hypothetical protein